MDIDFVKTGLNQGHLRVIRVHGQLPCGSCWTVRGQTHLGKPKVCLNCPWAAALAVSAHTGSAFDPELREQTEGHHTAGSKRIRDVTGRIQSLWPRVRYPDDVDVKTTA